jgi:hypothetical protein
MASKRIPIEQFLPLYLKAAEQGMTKEEFAESVGLKPATVYQRAYEIRAEGHDIPLLKSAGRVPLREKVEAILADYSSGKAKSKPAQKKEVTQAKETVEESDPLADILG